jgi:ethanolamine utilization protein EutQ (cupin superfamily)
LGVSNQFSKDADKPISAGFYRLEAGKELVYPYTYDEMKIILEGIPRGEFR